MEGVLVSAATGALNSVLEKLGTLLVDGYKLHKGVHGEIKFLTAELTAMHAFLLKMSEEEDPDVQDKVWMSTVRELSYDIEDSIDDFMQDEDDKDTKPDGFISKIKHILGKLGKRKAHHQMFQDLKKQVIEAADRNQRYKTGQALSSTKNATVDPRALAIFEHASRLVGIDEPKAEIIKLLTEEDGCASTQHRPKVVSVVGSGGMGKTTLANQVYQDLKGKFKCRAFVSVSRNPDMMNILRTILSEVSGGYYSHTATGSIQQLLSNISDFLVDKSYFIVVDDIWEKKTWDVIKSAFPMNSCGIIITTTRIKDVANSCQSSFGGHIYNIRPLDIVQSRKLFHGRLFNSEENCPPYLKEVSDRILKKCAGLPLAIIAISGLLANTERTEDLWNQVKDSIGRALERNSSVEGMMKILSLSYFDLPPHLKTCLLYVSIFSEDSIIEKDDLIRRWIGEEFIRKEGRYTAHEIGERCFNELLNRGLIQPGRPNEYGEVENCQVHDTILDFIISKSIEENFVTLLGVLDPTNGTQSKVIRRLSLQGINKENSTILPACLVLSHVRSFHAGGFVKIPSLEEFRHLRVLDLSQPFLSNQQLEEHYLENIVTLFQLRYLHLKYTRIHKLPEQIGRLGCLEMLDLRGTDVKELPASIVNLRKLSHLLLDRHVKFPDGIAKMQALEMLKYVSITMQTFDFLSGLGELKNLRDLGVDLVFRVYSATGHVDVVREEYNKAIISSLCKLGTQNLHSLTILNGSSLLQEHLCLRTLKKLITRYSPVPQVPNWVSSLRNLQQLCLVMMRVKQNELCILGALPTLLILHLDVRESSEKLGISDEVGFQILRIFIYNANYNPVDLMFAAGSMPKLEKLVLEFLREVESESLDFGIENLPCLSTVEANGEYGYVKPVRTALERAVGTHPNHPSLLFRRLRRQWSILPDSDDELPTLRTSFYDTPI